MITEIKQETKGAREALAAIQKSLNALMDRGVSIELTVASDKKTVSIPAEKEISFELKANVNSEV